MSKISLNNAVNDLSLESNFLNSLTKEHGVAVLRLFGLQNFVAFLNYWYLFSAKCLILVHF